MPSHPSTADTAFKTAFEAGTIPPAEFHHREHIQLAYVYLCEGQLEQAHQNMRAALQNFLSTNGVPADKYHETLTLSWIQAVRHFMDRAGPTLSFADFIAADDRLLDSKIMLSHYSSDHLFSNDARKSFVAPDLSPIPAPL